MEALCFSSVNFLGFLFELDHCWKCQCFENFGNGKNVWLERDTRAFHRHQVQTLESEIVFVSLNHPFKLSIHRVQPLFCSRPQRLATEAHPACVSINSADKVLCFTTGYLDLLRLFHLHRPPPHLSPSSSLTTPSAVHARRCVRSSLIRDN